jgi:hypothetical protein
MEDKPYTKEDFLVELKKYSSKFKDEKESFNAFFHTHITYLVYKSSSGEMKPAIVCSCKPLIKLFLKGLKYKDSKIRVILNKLNLNKSKLTGKTKKINTFSLMYRDKQTIPLENVKISLEECVVLSEDNYERICSQLTGLAKAWKSDNHLKRIFS